MDWFLYDRVLYHERVKLNIFFKTEFLLKHVLLFEMFTLVNCIDSCPVLTRQNFLLFLLSYLSYALNILTNLLHSEKYQVFARS